MSRHEVDVYRNDRGYASPMEDEDGEDENMDEDVEEEQAGEPEKEVEENFNQECQDYYERRERLKELEREKLRRSSKSGRRELEVKRKPLPYDNYGSFFGPSEPVIARRIIADARAREDASKVTARQSKEISEPSAQQHRIFKGPSGVSKSAPQSSVVDKPKQYASPNQALRRSQQLKEARDYSFLLNDEDPPVSPPRNDVLPAKKKIEGNGRPKEANTFVKGGSAVAKRLPNPGKTGALTLAKPPMGAKPMKANISPIPKGLPFQQKNTNPAPKLSKVPERPPMAKAKQSSQSVSYSNSNKTISGPGRPPQARSNGSAQGIINGKKPAISSSQGILNGKKPLSSSSAAQLKSLVASNSKGAVKQSTSNIANKVTPGKAALPRQTSAGGFERTPSRLPGGRSQASTSQPDLKRPSGVAARQGTSAGPHGQRRPAQLAATSKQVNKPPPRMLKRPRDSDSEDSFLDDEDGGGGDVSSMIRKMFGYNPNKYRDLDDEDDRFMETNFHSIQMEEKRSARIAREEDDREQLLIEEEERRERERAKKKRKQQR